MSPVDAPTSRRERKKNATRESIHEAALSLPEELGLTGGPLDTLFSVLVEVFLPTDTTAEQLSRRCGVLRSEPTRLAALHPDFEEKERAMVAVVPARTAQQTDSDLYRSLVVSAAVCAMRVAIMRWCERDGEETLESFVQEAFYHLANGLIVSPTERRPL